MVDEFLLKLSKSLDYGYSYQLFQNEGILGASPVISLAKAVNPDIPQRGCCVP